MSVNPEVAVAPVSVVIPVLGRALRARRVVERLLSCNPRPAEILIYCNGLPDFDPQREVEALGECAIPLWVLGGESNLGPGGGRHALIHAASQEWVASFDDDSWPLDEDYFARAVELLEARPEAAVLSPAVYLQEKPIMPRLAEVSVVRSFEGSASMLRRSVYIGLQGYVPVPASYAVEETDLALQLAREGWEILSSPWLRAWHDRPWADYAHSILPWICNEVLLVYLRFPPWMQLWGWWRAFRRICSHRHDLPLMTMLGALAQVPGQLAQRRHWVKRLSAAELWRHRRSKMPRYLLQRDESGALELKLAPPMPRVLFLQYSNPGAYPPLQHAAQVLARAGWLVRFLGVRGGSTEQLQMPAQLRVRVELQKDCPPGWAQKLHYLGFVSWSILVVLCWRPHWVYVSDPLATPLGWLSRVLLRKRVLYHEHDYPLSAGGKSRRLAQRLIAWARRSILRAANLVVVPGEDRLRQVRSRDQVSAPVEVVWNTPVLREVPSEPAPQDPKEALCLLYHGSIVPERVGLFILEAMALCRTEVRLRLVGYFPPGASAHRECLLLRAAELGLQDRLQILPPTPRHLLLAQGRGCHLGLCLLQTDATDLNLGSMAGASNKVFDYLSQGLAVIVPDDPSWQEMLVRRGMAFVCNFGDAPRLAALLDHIQQDRAGLAEMGRRGHRQVMEHWHYEKSFAPVLQRMQAAIQGADPPYGGALQ